MCVQEHMPLHKHLKVGGSRGMPSFSLCRILLRQGLFTLNLELAVVCSNTVSALPVPVPPFSTAVTDAHGHTHFLNVGPQALNSGPQACTASALTAWAITSASQIKFLTEQSFQK